MIELLTVDSGAKEGTMSVVSVDGIICCWALELPWIDNEVNISCVPAGEYNVSLLYSKKFKMLLWELIDVPGRSECKFHIANYQDEIKGCMALGTVPRMGTNGQYSVGESTTAFEKFMKMMNGRKHSTLIIYNRPSLS